MGCARGPGIMENKGGKVHGQKAVEANDSGLSCAESEYHVPNSGRVERREAGAQPTWGPVQDGYRDDIRQSAEPAKKETSVFVELSVLYLGWYGTRVRERDRMASCSGGRDHVAQFAVKGQCRVMEFVAVLPFAEKRDGHKVLLERLPLRNVERGSAVMTFSADALKAGAIFAVV